MCQNHCVFLGQSHARPFCADGTDRPSPSPQQPAHKTWPATCRSKVCATFMDLLLSRQNPYRKTLFRELVYIENT